MEGCVYEYKISDTLNNKIDSSKLAKEISNSEITVSLECIDTNDDDIYVIFKNVLSSNEQDILTNIINNHDGIDDNIPDEFIITEDKSKVGGYYQVRSITFSAPANSTHEEVVTWPYNVRILSITLSKTQDGDFVIGTFMENTPVGVLIERANKDENFVKVSDTAIDNFKVGFRLTLGNENFYVIKIDKVNKTIYLDKNLENYYDEGTPVLLTIMFTYDPIETSKDIKIACGFSALGGSFINANMPFKLKYINKSNNDIRVRLYIETWY